MTVLCLVEHEASEVIDASLRALSFARTLGESSGEALVAALVGEISAPTLEALGAFGVSEAYGIESEELDSYAPLGWARAIVGLASSLPATAVVAAGTDRGNEVMAHAGALTGLAMVANCLERVEIWRDDRSPQPTALGRQSHRGRGRRVFAHSAHRRLRRGRARAGADAGFH